MTNVLKIISEALIAHRAMREWIMAFPKDVALPTMPGIDGDWLDEVEANLVAAFTQTEYKDDPAYKEAKSLAEALFKKHFAHEEHYASGRVVWEVCDSTAGIISQIDNMVCQLVHPKEQPTDAPLLTDKEILLEMHRALPSMSFVSEQAFIDGVKAGEQATRRKVGLE